MQSRFVASGFRKFDDDNWPTTTKEIEVDRALNLTEYYYGTNKQDLVALCQICRTDYLKCSCAPSVGHPLDVCDIPPKLN